MSPRITVHFMSRHSLRPLAALAALAALAVATLAACAPDAALRPDVAQPTTVGLTAVACPPCSSCSVRDESMGTAAPVSSSARSRSVKPPPLTRTLVSCGTTVIVDATGAVPPGSGPTGTTGPAAAANAPVPHGFTAATRTRYARLFVRPASVAAVGAAPVAAPCVHVRPPSVLAWTT